ncbi:hypothetical protein DICVIV_02341 [Dictyocaulus viviparus]|uniref:Uncharacterized protein n=1 Tax=Dictyocaulus viviparus TaxID=29172 RepID=A0A0D8Y3Q5_DICVI|nr:hypothetical protein DICVIV_02341 [Dictyocaulus viviparus]
MKSFKDVGVEVNMSDNNSASVEEIELENVNTLRLDQTPLSTLYSLPTFSRSVQSTQLNETYTCESSIPDNNLTMADLEIIREHLEKNGKLNESKQMSLSWLSDNIAALTSLMPHSGVQLEHLIGKEYMSLSWLSDNIAALTSLMPHSGVQLEHLIGKEYVYVKDALMALDLLSAHGTITAMELAVSEDARLLSKKRRCTKKSDVYFEYYVYYPPYVLNSPALLDQLYETDRMQSKGQDLETHLLLIKMEIHSHQLDRLTFHSLANVIRNILKERTE